MNKKEIEKEREKDTDTQIRVLMLQSVGLDADEIAERLQLKRDDIRQILGHRPTLTLRQGDLY